MYSAIATSAMFISSTERTFQPFRRFARASSLRDASKAKPITSAWARHMDAESYRNARISDSRTCRVTVAGLAMGLTRLSLIESTGAPWAAAVSTAWTVSSA